MSQAAVSIYHDTRRGKTKGVQKTNPDSVQSKNNEVYPVRLRVYFKNKTRFYPTGIDLTVRDFLNSYGTHKPKKEFEALRDQMIAIRVRAKNIADGLGFFNIDEFEKQLLKVSGSGADFFNQYYEKIETLNKQDRIGTASNYDLSAKSILHFLFHTGKLKDLESQLKLKEDGKSDFLSIVDYARFKGIDIQQSFRSVTPEFLHNYERWMLGRKSTKTTVGFYLRPFRAIFNKAIADGEVPEELYPFGKNRYQIPQGRKVNKSLTKEDLKQLLAVPVDKGSVMEKARDFFFFSYVANGMNMKDIALLKYKDIRGTMLSFYRVKVENTTRVNLKPIIVPLNQFALEFIDKYASKPVKPEKYVFPILSEELSEREKFKKVQAFTRSINEQMKKLAQRAGVTEDISTYFARHSFTTISVRNGASFAFVQESLGHASIKTTMDYFGGFLNAEKLDNANQLMNFDV